MTTTAPGPRIPASRTAAPLAPAPPTTGGKHAAPPTSGHATAEDAAKAREKIIKLKSTIRQLTFCLITIGLGALVFTASNVTQFAIGHGIHPYIAWMMDPLVCGALLAVLWADGVLTDIGGYRPTGWPFRLRWFAGLATWLMNCWESLFPDTVFRPWPTHADPAGLVLHSAIPFLLIALSEAIAGYRKHATVREAQLQKIIDSYQEGLRAEKAAEQAAADAARQRREKEEQERRDAEREDARIQRELALKEAEEKTAATRIAAEAEAQRLLQEQQFRQEQLREDAVAERARKAAETAARLAHEEEERKRRQKREEAEQAERKAQAERAEKERLKTAKAAERRQPAAPATSPAPAATAKVHERTPDGHGDHDCTMSQAERKAQRDRAVRFTAKKLVMEDDITTRQIGEEYGKSPSWGRQVLHEAKERLANDKEFRDEVETEALAEMVAA